MSVYCPTSDVGQRGIGGFRRPWPNASLHAYLVNIVESKEETMSREQSLRNGAGLMVLGALIFLVYAVVFFFRAFANGGFELGVETLNGVTPDQLDKLNPAIMGVIRRAILTP
jgi:hypothetical protein